MAKYLVVSLLFMLSVASLCGGTVRVCNNGVYLAKCYLESRTLLYGIPAFRTDTGLFPIFQCSTLDLPVEAVYNRLECKTLAFIAVYKSIFVQEFASPFLNYCYKIGGTTLMPTWSQNRLLVL